MFRRISVLCAAYCMLAADVSLARSVAVLRPPWLPRVGTPRAKPVEATAPSRTGPVLTLTEAMARAATHNPQAQMAAERARGATGAAWEHRAGMLPHLDGRVSQMRQNVDRSASGAIAAYNSFDARVAIVQQIINVSALHEWRVGRAVLNAAELTAALAKDQARRDAALAYLDAQRTAALERSRAADVALAQDYAKFVHDQFDAGVVDTVEVVRAQTQVALTQTLRAEAATQHHAAELNLRRVIGMPLGAQVNIEATVERFENKLVPPALDNALRIAHDRRIELQVANAEVAQARAMQQSATAKQLPSLAAVADYGGSGTQYNRELDATYRVGVQLSVPIFDGGVTASRIVQARSAQRQAQLQHDDIATQVEMDVRLAHQQVQEMRAQVASAQHAAELANREITNVRAQFREGVADGVAMIAAHHAVTVAREAALAAQAQYDAARIALAYAQGQLEGFHL